MLNHVSDMAPSVLWCSEAKNTRKQSPDHVGGLTSFFLDDALSPHALAAALPTAKTFDEGYDRRVWLNAAPNKPELGQVPTWQYEAFEYVCLAPLRNPDVLLIRSRRRLMLGAGGFLGTDRRWRGWEAARVLLLPIRNTRP